MNNSFDLKCLEGKLMSRTYLDRKETLLILDFFQEKHFTNILCYVYNIYDFSNKSKTYIYFSEKNIKTLLDKKTLSFDKLKFKLLS